MKHHMYIFLIFQYGIRSYISYIKLRKWIIILRTEEYEKVKDSDIFPLQNPGCPSWSEAISPCQLDSRCHHCLRSLWILRRPDHLQQSFIRGPELWGTTGLSGKHSESCMNQSQIQEQLWQSWHGDSHFIADDKRNWKEHCPTFTMILDRIRHYFDMDIKATRLNW